MGYNETLFERKTNDETQEAQDTKNKCLGTTDRIIFGRQEKEVTKPTAPNTGLGFSFRRENTPYNETLRKEDHV